MTRPTGPVASLIDWRGSIPIGFRGCSGQDEQRQGQSKLSPAVVLESLATPWRLRFAPPARETPRPSRPRSVLPVILVERVATQYQEDLPVVRPVVRRFDIEVGHCAQCRRRVQGRHALQTSDALGAARVQLGPEVDSRIAISLPQTMVSAGAQGSKSMKNRLASCQLRIAARRAGDGADVQRRARARAVRGPATRLAHDPHRAGPGEGEGRALGARKPKAYHYGRLAGLELRSSSCVSARVSWNLAGLRAALQAGGP